MSIFRKGRETPSAPQPSNPSPAPRPQQTPPRREAPAPAAAKTHIALGTKVVGEITGNAELVIDGVVEGEIHLDSRVTVGAGGTVNGTIYAVAVQVGGKVFGNIHGKETVEVLASGRLEGDITAPSVPIAKGAFFQGSVSMGSPEPKSGGNPKKSAKGGAKDAAGRDVSKKGGERSGQNPAKSNAPGQAGGKK